MKVSVAWLAEYVDVGTDVSALAKLLTMAGFEVEAVTPAAPPFTGVVVAEVLKTERHPDADKLNVCQVLGADSQTVTIVCGASNVRPGIKVPLAQVGARLPAEVVIQRAKLRGIESFGMLCSARELGLGENSEGLLELPANATTGQNLREALTLDDAVLTVNFTPNRGDALSVLGLAREVSVLRNTALKVPPIPAVAATVPNTLETRLSAPNACPRLLGRVLVGLNPKALTPLYMQERLRRAGLRSRGPLVDVTNYVMLELGQPMHAYDLRQLQSFLEVRLAAAGETLTLLEGSTVALEPDMLIIADATGPVGLAGVMGGLKSAIAQDTCDVFLEVAFFNPDAIAGRGRRFGLLTDASQRFERGVDPFAQVRALERATALLLEIAGGAAGPVIETCEAAALPTRPPIELSHAYLARLLGVSIAPNLVVSILSSLGFVVEATASGVRAIAPSWRFDVTQSADLVEEVARIYGYNAIPEIDAPMPQRPGLVPEGLIAPERLAETLVARGYSEVINYTFVDPKMQGLLFPSRTALALKNPISSELAEMRISLWPGLLKVLGDNVRRQQSRVKIFEFGRRFIVKDTDLTELNTISGLLFGPALSEQWGTQKRVADFYDLKNDVEALFAASGQGLELRVESLPCLHPGRSARVLSSAGPCGWLGELHPQLARALDLSHAPYLFEIDMVALTSAVVPSAVEISKFPAVRRDLAVVVDETITFNQLRASVTVAASSLEHKIVIFDVYRGPGIETGRKSVALGLIFQEILRTLTESEVDGAMLAVRQQLERDVGAVCRD